MKRIIVSVTNDLVTDQRVYKVCKTLQDLNYDILLIGRKLKDSLPIARPYKTYRMRLFFNKGFLFYAEFNIRLFFKLLFTKKTVLLANDLDTLLPNYLISILQHKKLVYDSHELFTEVPELISRPKVQKIWLTIEQWILPKLKNCYTVSQSIANYYSKKYNIQFIVIRNLPEKIKFSKNSILWKNPENKKIILYQGALNIGRGLELMIETMKKLDDCLFIIIGEGDILTKLKKQVHNFQLNDRIQFLGRIKPKKLKHITPNADIGISLEEDLGLSYRYSLPNKIFDYIHAEIPIVVSDLPEMKKIIEIYNVGEIQINRNPKHLANTIDNILKRDKSSWKNNFITAQNDLSWEFESQRLILFFTKIK